MLAASVKDSGYIASLFVGQTFPTTLLRAALCWEVAQPALCSASPSPWASPGNVALTPPEHGQHGAGHTASGKTFWGRRLLTTPRGHDVI